MNKQLNLDERIGSKIKQLRESNKLTRLQLARVLGYESDTAVYLIEAGKRGIDSSKLNTAATYFKISVDELMGKIEPKEISIRSALRADKKLTEKDMAYIEKFVQFLKEQS